MSIAILKPNQGHITYTKATETFRDLYQKVIGKEIPITEADDGISDLIVIGSDSVNDFLMREVLDLNIKSLGIRYGTDDYSILTYKKDNRNVLILAGGRGRSTLYAVYDYFERYAGCHYFWDGDIIPHRNSLPMENISIVESPRFFYRGLRYFAHRGLKRFQAELWSFEDWKQELDWMVKKRLNFFMLRIGMDDVWQRAFPDDVPYPEEYRTITGADAQGYDDRSDFWTLKYKGDLKAKVLEYARKLDLMYPTDCGTMTHWYSRTPLEFLENKKPTFLEQEIEHYTSSDTGKVFDFTKKENMDYYMHLTETMVKEHEKSTALFHTIGLGERRIFRDKDKNFALKLIAYRRIAENIRQRYPESKLMLASWDFCGFWSTDEVAALFRELDPERTILLDYTSDMNDPDHSFLKWDVVGKFPYIFGMFHAYESESELRGNYNRTDERLKVAAEDPYCKGMILWPELAHSDPIVLEYLTQNSWAPLKKSVEEITEEFCHNRYGEYSKYMNKCWQKILPFIKLNDWGGEGHARPYEKQSVELCQSWYIHLDLWTRFCVFANSPESGREDLREFFLYKADKSIHLSDNILTALRMLVENPKALKEPFILRDSIDIVRTVLGRFMNYIIVKALCSKGEKESLEILKAYYFEIINIMAELLSLNTDFSLYHSLKELESVTETNPNFEVTLKRNICNGYCSQSAYELVTQIFKNEGEVVFDRLINADANSTCNFVEEYKNILEKFMNTPLKNMQPNSIPKAEDVISKATNVMEKLLKSKLF